MDSFTGAAAIAICAASIDDTVPRLRKPPAPPSNRESTYPGKKAFKKIGSWFNELSLTFQDVKEKRRPFAIMFAQNLFLISLLTFNWRLVALKKAEWAGFMDFWYFLAATWMVKKIVKTQSRAETLAYCLSGALGTYLGTKFF